MSRQFDVCNGDADGLCAAVQWHWHDPSPATLMTGLKREIELLARVPALRGDEVNVFDLSMQRNRAALLAMLEAGVCVRYFDHHAVRDIPSHALLDVHIDGADDVCTCLLVDRYVAGAYRAWALVGAYGDNLNAVADRLAMDSGFSLADRSRLRRLGEVLNYNAYGQDEHDVFIRPAELFKTLAAYTDPLEMLKQERIFDDIDEQRLADLALARACVPYQQGVRGVVYVLPNEAWSRRVIGCFANTLVNAHPRLAHLVLMCQRPGVFMASVRAPLVQPAGADDLCCRFGGSGRARSAGIDELAEADRDRFVAAFLSVHWG